MKTKHDTEEVVMRYMAIKNDKKRKISIFDDLRKKGNFLYNQEIIRDPMISPK